MVRNRVALAPSPIEETESEKMEVLVHPIDITEFETSRNLLDTQNKTKLEVKPCDASINFDETNRSINFYQFPPPEDEKLCTPQPHLSNATSLLTPFL